MSGKGVGTYAMSLNDEDYEDTFFGRGRGKGQGKRRTTGKSKGRRQNPRGRDGRIRECHTPGCHSTTHLWRDCPLKGKGKGSGPSQLHGPPNSAHYVETFEELYMITVVDLSSEEDA